MFGTADDKSQGGVMKVLRTRPVIGVFGSSVPETLDLAEEIGYQIAVRDCILLTGGTGHSRSKVKDRAIFGARRARQQGYVAAWVGVRRTDLPEVSEPDGSGLLLAPGYRHKRNYVEAHLCDAAIALPGGRGTASEAAFCLVLRRPIILVGPKWEANYRLSVENNAAAVAQFFEDTRTPMSSHEQESPQDTAI
jgi:predicted Rossmann-fold nucleotide-binding protein